MITACAKFIDGSLPDLIKKGQHFKEKAASTTHFPAVSRKIFSNVSYVSLFLAMKQSCQEPGLFTDAPTTRPFRAKTKTQPTKWPCNHPL
jgi:hypothetical protein